MAPAPQSRPLVWRAAEAARGLQDSQIVEELLWLALSLVEEHP